MNFADIEKTWRSAENRPSAAQLERQKMELINELHRRRRASRSLLVRTAIPLGLITALLLLHLLWPDSASDRLNLTREWAILPFLLLPWVGWFLLWRQHRRHASAHADHARSIQASTAALLDENLREGFRALVIVAALLLSLPLLGGVVWQLRAVGKMGDEVLIPAFVLYPAYVVLMVAWIGWKHLRKTTPRRKELEALLSDYNRVA
ncbi:hypothetical protein ESB00_03050 [Oleiharenicola lentus]|uniref:Uncharacterized protein n=1 Tax=Oleiharenicola lentus TaxID=2508720 RepID=A0A4Q1C7Q4_9BACT|nr:hypothetical protein [Oleiharenicola lentus]RXK54888.1 hypothetical protein ESB00_03050 [Oleiharenicola lentus]